MAHRLSSAALTAALLAAACSGAAAEPTRPSTPPFRFLDLRLGTGTTEAPNVTERVTTPTGPTTIDWGDAKSSPRASLVVLGGWSWVNTGPIIGVEASFTRHTLGSDTLGATEVHMNQQSALLLAGWQYGITQDREMRAHVEFTPMYGAVVSYFDRGEPGHVTRPEYGARLGVFLSERQITAGIVGTYLRSTGTLTTPTGPGSSSEVSYSIKGYRLSAEVGYRF